MRVKFILAYVSVCAVLSIIMLAIALLALVLYQWDKAKQAGICAVTFWANAMLMHSYLPKKDKEK